MSSFIHITGSFPFIFVDFFKSTLIRVPAVFGVLAVRKSNLFDFLVGCVGIMEPVCSRLADGMDEIAKEVIGCKVERGFPASIFFIKKVWTGGDVEFC